MDECPNAFYKFSNSIILLCVAFVAYEVRQLCVLKSLNVLYNSFSILLVLSLYYLINTLMLLVNHILQLSLFWSLAHYGNKYSLSLSILFEYNLLSLYTWSTYFVNLPSGNILPNDFFALKVIVLFL